MYLASFIFKLLSLLIGLLLHASSSNAQSVEHSGQIKKEGQYYSIDGAYLSYSKLAQLLQTYPESEKLLLKAEEYKKASKTIGIMGLIATGITTLAVSCSRVGGAAIGVPVIVVGAATLARVIMGFSSANKSIKSGIAFYNAKLGNPPIQSSHKVSYQLQYTGNGLGLKVQF
jgi:hypothetical protein